MEWRELSEMNTKALAFKFLQKVKMHFARFSSNFLGGIGTRT